MRKQILIIICVAIASFLFGTLVSMGLTAMGIMPNPFEEPASEIQTIRFSKSEEVNVTAMERSSYYYFANFVWNPRNPQSNSIIAVYCQLEYRTEPPEQFTWGQGNQFLWELQFNVRINELESEPTVISTSATTQQEWEEENPIEWQYVSFVVHPAIYEYGIGSWICPNRDIYGWGLNCYHRLGWESQTYIRNINVVMEVIDG